MVTDSASCSNFLEVAIRHIDLDWDVHFDNKYISGIATYTADVLKDTDHITFDGRDLKISDVIYNNESHKFSTDDAGIYGQRIVLHLGKFSANTQIKFSIKYSTSNNASALQFVDADLTMDKKAPFLYSQCEPIHARSIVPCMDTPSIKQTYSAKVRVPNGLICLMSALSVGNSMNDSTTTYSFSQPVVIPSYLLAIVSGVLEKRDISERCAIWAEPSQIDKAHWEFADTEKMVQVGEELFGKYSWNRYDMVLLPPFFPFGGMENSTLTFLTPTLIAGDRSLTNVIAHEIAHSWTGNLVTNANWENFWLNEGFTVFLERKIMAKLYGESERQFHSICGWQDTLLPTIDSVFSPTHEFTKLIPNLTNCDPDDAFSSIPYEKGAALLLYIEQQLGDVERFNQFLRSYIAKYAQKSITSDEFKAYLYEFFHDQTSVLDSIDFDKWFYSPGVPPNKPKYDDTLVTECLKLAEEWLKGTDENIENIDPRIYLDMRTSQRCKVLSHINQFGPILPERAAKLDNKYSLSASKNCELLSTWIEIGLKAKYEPIVETALAFVVAQGRIKYSKPIYKLLFSWDHTRTRAIETFEKNIPFMHPITVQVIKSLLK